MPLGVLAKSAEQKGTRICCCRVTCSHLVCAARFALIFLCVRAAFRRLFSPAVLLRFRSRRCVASALLPPVVRSHAGTQPLTPARRGGDVTGPVSCSRARPAAAAAAAAMPCPVVIPADLSVGSGPGRGLMPGEDGLGFEGDGLGFEGSVGDPDVSAAPTSISAHSSSMPPSSPVSPPTLGPAPSTAAASSAAAMLNSCLGCMPAPEPPRARAVARSPFSGVGSSAGLACPTAAPALAAALAAPRIYGPAWAGCLIKH